MAGRDVGWNVYYTMFVSRVMLLWFVSSTSSVLSDPASAGVRQLSYCSSEINGRIINLEPLGVAFPTGLDAQYTDRGQTWNYTYKPCYDFNKPKDPRMGFGDRCRSVSVCKYNTQGQRQYYYALGFQETAKFLVEVDQEKNETNVAVVFETDMSFKGKKSIIKLICDRSRTKPQDALFKVIGDAIKLGDMVAELHHLCSCPDGCPVDSHSSLQVDKEKSNSSTTVPAKGLSKKSTKVVTDRAKVLIIVGVNIGVILLAGLVGLMCYSKKSHLEIYHKLPGVRATPDPTLWQMATTTDLEKAIAPQGPISSTAHQGVSLRQSVSLSAKESFRDGAPNPSRRKSFCFPVLEHCMIPEECITMGQRLGGGIFGDTYIGEWTGITVAVKRITLSVHKYQMSLENIKHLQELVGFLSTQRHRNIVSTLGFCSESKHPYIISEFINGQVVKDFIKNAGQQLTWPHRVKILSQVADGMAFLHSTNPPILHRDLRCGNLFITDNDVIKICDFGIVKLTQPLRASCQTEDCCCQGLYSACPPSIAWTAPEVLEHPNTTEDDEYITPAVDVYSYAIVMWELVMCDDPYEDMNTAQEVMDHVKGGGRPQLSPGSTMLAPYLELMKKCWSVLPEERYSFKQVTVHLKELLYQAKHFQKALSSKHSRTRSSYSKTITEDSKAS